MRQRLNLKSSRVRCSWWHLGLEGSSRRVESQRKMTRIENQQNSQTHTESVNNPRQVNLLIVALLIFPSFHRILESLPLTFHYFRMNIFILSQFSLFMIPRKGSAGCETLAYCWLCFLNCIMRRQPPGEGLIERAGLNLNHITSASGNWELLRTAIDSQIPITSQSHLIIERRKLSQRVDSLRQDADPSGKAPEGGSWMQRHLFWNQLCSVEQWEALTPIPPPTLQCITRMEKCFLLNSNSIFFMRKAFYIELFHSAALCVKKWCEKWCEV